MSKMLSKNTKVEWPWGNSTGEGQIKEGFKEKITKSIKGSEITRNGSDDDPAYLIEQEDGDQVLKLHSELSGSS